MAWVSESKPGFDIINILPSVILGYNELTTSKKTMLSSGTNRLVASIVSGIPVTGTNSVGATVHVVSDVLQYKTRKLQANSFVSRMTAQKYTSKPSIHPSKEIVISSLTPPKWTGVM